MAQKHLVMSVAEFSAGHYRHIKVCGDLKWKSARFTDRHHFLLEVGMRYRPLLVAVIASPEITKRREALALPVMRPRYPFAP